MCVKIKASPFKVYRTDTQVNFFFFYQDEFSETFKTHLSSYIESVLSLSIGTFVRHKLQIECDSIPAPILSQKWHWNLKVFIIYLFIVDFSIKLSIFHSSSISISRFLRQVGDHTKKKALVQFSKLVFNYFCGFLKRLYVWSTCCLSHKRDPKKTPL